MSIPTCSACGHTRADHRRAPGWNTVDSAKPTSCMFCACTRSHDAIDAEQRDVDLATDLGFTACPQCGQRSAADALCEACARDLTDLQRDRADEWDAPFREDDSA